MSQPNNDLREKLHLSPDNLFSVQTVSFMRKAIQAADSNEIFFIGSVINGIILMRLLNHIIKYIKFSGGKITPGSENIQIVRKDGDERILTEYGPEPL